MNTKHKLFLTVRDHSVSKEVFGLYHDKELDMLVTFPKPEGKKLQQYYESEDYISHTDGKRSLFEKAYQFIKNIALKKKLSLINEFQPAKGNLLDIGCGTGDFLATAKNDGWQITGIEPSEKAKNIAASKGVSFAENTEELESHSFDAITMWHVLEHVPDLEKQIDELKRLLKPEGTIFIAVPNFKSADAKQYKEYWAAYDAPRHLWHFSKTAIQSLFGKARMDVVKILPMKFDAFYVCLLSEKYKNGQMNLITAFLNGWRSNRKAKRTLEYSSHIYVIKNN